MKKTLFFLGAILITFSSLCAFAQEKSKPIKRVHKTEQLQQKTAQLIPGETVTFCTSGDYKITYHVYTPSNFNVQSPPPIVIGFSAGGNGKGILNAYAEAAETMGWIGVGCDTLRNNMRNEIKEREIEDELMNNILKSIPHNPKRIYLTGGSGGAMRAYGLSARRSENIVGILAHGGWLGGPAYQDKPYKENMSVTMLNGNLDMGAGRWTVTDTKTLQNRNCKVKHFTCMGGHMVAPASVTLIAMKWIDEQWEKRDLAETKKIDLKILFVGNNDQRSEAYKQFLDQHFTSVNIVSTSEVTLNLTNEADILLLDNEVYTLPDNYNKAMVLIGSPAIKTGQRFGSKTESLGIYSQLKLIDPDTSHAIFKKPYTLNKPQNFTKSIATTTLLLESKNHKNSNESEILFEGLTENGNRGAIILQEASRLIWGNTAVPNKMPEEFNKLFINALVWIHQLDGLRQSEYSGITPRDSIAKIIEQTDLKSDEALRWFPPEILEKCAFDNEKLHEYYKKNQGYIYTNYGSGQLRVDAIIQKMETPNNNLASIEKWISMLDGKDRKLANPTLIRYTNQFIRGSKKWKDWYTKNAGHLEFRDDLGYIFHVK